MSVYSVLQSRGVTRLCHFTKLQQLTHILSSGEGILASNSIRPDIKNVTDQARYDGELNYVCCSVEYPNSWFLNKAIQRDTDTIFNEWVVIFIDLGITNSRITKFCPCNASKDHGLHISDNIYNIERIFDRTVPAFIHQRPPRMLSCCPTNGQAEILIKDNIPREFFTGIAVGNHDMARRVYAMIKTLSINPLTIYIAPKILSTNWSQMVRNGLRPDEEIFDLTSEE